MLECAVAGYCTCATIAAVITNFPMRHYKRLAGPATIGFNDVAVATDVVAASNLPHHEARVRNAFVKMAGRAGSREGSGEEGFRPISC